MRNGNQGQIRIIEAFLAVLIIFSSFAVSSNMPVSQNLSGRKDLTSVGLQALSKLDSEGSLNTHITNGNWSALRDTLNIVLPSGVSFNLTVYNEQMQQINTDIISNGAFSSQEVASVEYTCASKEAIFRIYLVRMLLAVAK